MPARTAAARVSYTPRPTRSSRPASCSAGSRTAICSVATRPAYRTGIRFGVRSSCRCRSPLRDRSAGQPLQPAPSRRRHQDGSRLRLTRDPAALGLRRSWRCRRENSRARQRGHAIARQHHPSQAPPGPRPSRRCRVTAPAIQDRTVISAGRPTPGKQPSGIHEPVQAPAAYSGRSDNRGVARQSQLPVEGC